MDNLARPLIDYAPAVDTRAERRQRIFWRCAWVVSSAILLLALWDLGASVMDHYARMERAATVGASR